VVLSVDIDAFVDVGQRATLCAAFADLDADMFWINVVNYDEIMAEPTDVVAVMGLVDELVATGRPVVLGYVGRTGLLAIAHGAGGYAAGTHGLEAHPRSFFREMMGSAVANTYYFHECMVNLPARLAEAAAHSGVVWQDVPCDCRGCQGSASVSRLVSRRLSVHAMLRRSVELEPLLNAPPQSRVAVLEGMYSTALQQCESVAEALGVADDRPLMAPGLYHYLEVLGEAAGGPPATLPGDDSF